MNEQNETGHGKNIANFERLIQFCRSYNEEYNPSVESQTLTQLDKLYAQAKEAVSKAGKAEQTFDVATNKRALAFENNKTFATQIVNAFAICGAEQRAIDDINGINRKIQGKRAGKLPDPDNKLKEGEKPPKQNSVSQQSYDSQKGHFEELRNALILENKYKPNEKHLSIEAVNKKLKEMESTNTQLGDMDTVWSDARIVRKAILYTPKTGLVAIALDVKKYVKSVYGAKHPRFIQVNEIPFKVIPD